MLIKTGKEQTKDPVLAALNEIGYREPDRRAEMAQILDENGADLRSVVGEVSNIMKTDEYGNVRHAAARTLLELHGVLGQKASAHGNTAIQIVIESSDQSRERLDAMLCPNPVGG